MEVWPTKRSDGQYSYVGSIGRDEYRTVNTINKRETFRNTSITQTTI